MTLLWEIRILAAGARARRRKLVFQSLTYYWSDTLLGAVLTPVRLTLRFGGGEKYLGVAKGSTEALR